MDKVLEHSKAKRAEVTEGISPINIEGTQTPNPHAWMSPTNAVKYVDNIEKRSSTCGEHKDEIHQNADRYRDELRKVDHELHQALKSCPSNPVPSSAAKVHSATSRKMHT